jgi:hypothetical protein
MEEKIVGEKKGSTLYSDISFTLLSIASLSSVFTYTAPALDLSPHSGSPTLQVTYIPISQQELILL